MAGGGGGRIGFEGEERVHVRDEPRHVGELVPVVDEGVPRRDAEEVLGRRDAHPEPVRAGAPLADRSGARLARLGGVPEPDVELDRHAGAGDDDLGVVTALEARIGGANRDEAGAPERVEGPLRRARRDEQVDVAHGAERGVARVERDEGGPLQRDPLEAGGAERRVELHHLAGEERVPRGVLLERAAQAHGGAASGPGPRRAERVREEGEHARGAGRGLERPPVEAARDERAQPVGVELAEEERRQQESALRAAEHRAAQRRRFTTRPGIGVSSPVSSRSSAPHT